MFVIRYTWHFQGTSFAKARKLFPQIQPPETAFLRGGRGYESLTGAANTLALEWEFDSLQDWEKFSALFFADPKNAEPLREYPDAEISTLEIWKLIE